MTASLVSYEPKSIRPASGTVLYGVGNSTTPFDVGANDVNGIGLWLKSSGTGDSRVIYSRLYMYGTGAGEAVRAYATPMNAAAATGGTLNGLHASLAVPASMGISGQGNAARFTLDFATASRTLGANMAGITVDSNIGASNTVGSTCAFIRIADLTAVKIPCLLNVPAAVNSTVFATHVTDAMTHSLRCVTDAGTRFFLMCTTTATNRGGGS